MRFLYGRNLPKKPKLKKTEKPDSLLQTPSRENTLAVG